VPIGQRLAAAAVALGSLGLLTVAMLLRPSPAGHGTHTALGMPPCSWADRLNAPCPACGMTTSFAYAANGDPLGSLRAQPFATLLALGTAAAFWAGLYIAATGSTLGGEFGRMLRPGVLWPLGALALLAWGYKFLTWPR